MITIDKELIDKTIYDTENNIIFVRSELDILKGKLEELKLHKLKLEHEGKI